jgi:hypothetical protein
MSTITGPAVGIDSKQIFKEWYPAEGGRKEFRALVGVAVNPSDNAAFERAYDRILGDLFQKFLLTRKRPVYCAAEIGTLLQPRGLAYKAFCLKFVRQVLSLPDIRVGYFVTRLNSTYLTDGKVTVYGEYGSAAKAIPAIEFIKLIYPSYNVICGWKFALQSGSRGQNFLFDGTDGVLHTGAWRYLSANQNIRIFYGGDRTIPVIATADVLIRSLDFFLEQRRGVTDEEAVRQIVLHGGYVPAENKSFEYIGNPDLPSIRPLRDSVLMPAEIAQFVCHPTIYMSAGAIYGQQAIIEGSALSERVYEHAAGIGAGVKLYDPRLDRAVIGSSKDPDLFVAFNTEARSQLEALRTGGRNVSELKFEGEGVTESRPPGGG